MCAVFGFNGLDALPRLRIKYGNNTRIAYSHVEMLTLGVEENDIRAAADVCLMRNYYPNPQPDRSTSSRHRRKTGDCFRD